MCESPFHITQQPIIDPLLHDVFMQSGLSIISVFNTTNKNSYEKFDKYCCNLNNINKPTLFHGPQCNNINKRTLFHGTHCDNICGILEHGLSIIKRDGVTDGGLFGHGIYTAVDPDKAHRYVKQNSQKYNPIRMMLRVEVAVGIPFLHNPNSFHRGCTEPPPGFNSVIGNINGFTEFVVYDRNAVRVTGIILYRFSQQFQLPGVVSSTNTQLFNMTLIYLKHIPTNSSNINLPVNLNKCFVNLLNFSLQQNNPFQNMTKMCSEINKLLFVFFKQQRSGRDLKNFTCYKFRTMHVGLTNNNSQAKPGDPRVTRFGAFLRKFSIDELPQFFNVLLGNMSVVGPRPHMLKHTEHYAEVMPHYPVRHYAKPGITGWAQINGFRGETPFLEDMKNRVEHDIWYIENWVFYLDIKIIFKTILISCAESKMRIRGL